MEGSNSLRNIETYEGEPSYRLPTTQGDIGAPAQRMPERSENAPGRDRNSQGPKDQAASLRLLLPDDNAFSIVTIHQTMTHMVLRVESVPELEVRSGFGSLHRNDIFFLTLDVMTIEIEDQRKVLNKCRSHTEIFTFDDTLAQSTPNALPGLFLISVITCTVK